MNRPDTPACALFDRRHASLDDLEPVRTSGWCWLTQLRSNRLVNPASAGVRPPPDLEPAATGTVVHRKGDGLINVFKRVTPNWRWLTQLRSNRLVNPDGTGLPPLPDLLLAATGTVGHRKSLQTGHPKR